MSSHASTCTTSDGLPMLPRGHVGKLHGRWHEPWRLTASIFDRCRTTWCGQTQGGNAVVLRIREWNPYMRLLVNNYECSTNLSERLLLPQNGQFLTTDLMVCQSLAGLKFGAMSSCHGLKCRAFWGCPQWKQMGTKPFYVKTLEAKAPNESRILHEKYHPMMY